MLQVEYYMVMCPQVFSKTIDPPFKPTQAQLNIHLAASCLGVCPGADPPDAQRSTMFGRRRRATLMLRDLNAQANSAWSRISA